MAFLVLPVEWAVPLSSGQLAVFGKAESAKANGSDSIIVPEISSTGRNVFFTPTSDVDPKFVLLGGCDDVSAARMIIRHCGDGDYQAGADEAGKAPGIYSFALPAFRDCQPSTRSKNARGEQ